MEKKNQWLVSLGEDNSYWPEENYDCNPSVINFEYEVLRDLAKKGNLYGGFLQIKDVFELVMKIPCVMGMIIVNSNPPDDSKPYFEIMNQALSKPLAMGDWNALAGVLYKYRSEARLPADLVKIIDKTRKLYNKKPFGTDMTIPAWRNQTIGHGALRFEDDPAFGQEITVLLGILKQYFQEDLGRLYETLYIEADGVRLTGSRISFDSEADALLHTENNTYPVNEFITRQDLSCFFFNSYYSEAKKAQFSSFMGGRAFLEKREYLDAIMEKLERMKLEGHTFRQRFTTRGEEMMLECLSKPDRYYKPAGLISALKKKMAELHKGIILIEMERGTGKSAFANQMSGLHTKAKELPIKDGYTRIYHLANASLRGINDFTRSVNYSFRVNYNPLNDLYSTEEEIAPFDLNDADPAASLADFLNTYHDLYHPAFTMLILDGADELTSETKKIIECIPRREMLDDGVFVVVLSRFEDENTVQSRSRKMIKEASSKADAVIQFRRNDPDNIKVMEQYIKAKSPSCQDPLKLIDKADHRFLYLKPYILVRDKAVLDSTDETAFFNSFTDYLLSLYPDAKLNNIKEALCVFALFPGITLKEYMKYLNQPTLTYTFIGILNDLMPLLTVTRHPDGSQYALADEAYTRAVLVRFPDTVKETAACFEKSLYEALAGYLAQREPSYQKIVHGRAVSNAAYSAEESLAFFGKNLLSLYRHSDSGHLLSDPKTCVDLAMQLGRDPLADSGYRKIIRDQLCGDVIKAVSEGLKTEREGHAGANEIYEYIKGQDPEYLYALKGALICVPSFDELYRQYTDSMGKDPLTEKFFWIIDSCSENTLSKEAMELIMEKADVSAFVRYFFSTGKIYCDMELVPPKEMLNEDAWLLLKDEGLTDAGPLIQAEETALSADEMKENIQKAMNALQDPDTDFSKTLNWKEDDPVTEVYAHLDQYQKNEEIHGMLDPLHRVYYTRLQAEQYPEYLFCALSFFNPAIVFMRILETLFPGKNIAAGLAEWSREFLRKADPGNSDPAEIPIDLAELAVELFRSQNDVNNAIIGKEYIAYQYSMIEYLGMEKWKHISSDLKELFPDETTPLTYCTPKIRNLLLMYREYNEYESAGRLIAYLNKTLPVIIVYFEKHGWDTPEIRYDCFRYFKIVRMLGIKDEEETVLKHFYDRKMEKITAFLDAADHHSDYMELEDLMDEYLEYDANLYDFKALRSHAEELIHLIRSREETCDAATNAILANEILHVRRKADDLLKGSSEGSGLCQ